MSGEVVVLEDSEGRVTRMREAVGTVRVFDRVRDLLAWVDGAEEAPRLISLDYHLASRAHGTGLQAAMALSARAPRCPVLIHSSDRIGAAHMAELLREGGWQVERLPFEAGGWAEAVARLSG